MQKKLLSLKWTIYISYNDQIINSNSSHVPPKRLLIYISYNDQIINKTAFDDFKKGYEFTFHIMIRL